MEKLKENNGDRGQRWGFGVQDSGEQFALKRLAILRAAARMFNQRGYYGTSLDELARELKVTKPSLYYYVKSKDDILVQILNVGMQQIDPAITTANANRKSGNGLEKLRLFVRHYVLVMTEEFGKCMVISGLAPLQPESRDEMLPAYRRIDRAVRGMIREGIRDGSIAPCDPKMTAFTLFGAMHLIPYWYRSDGKLGPAEIAEAQLALFENGLRGARAPGHRTEAAATRPRRKSADK